MITEKPCTRCHIVKPLEDFNKASQNKTHGRRPECKVCQSVLKREYYSSRPDVKRWNKIKRLYNMTQEQWENMFEEQGCKCAICPRTESGANGWHTDHDHTTGKVRGILCSWCNRALGYFMDSPDLLEQAQTYLQKR